MYGSFLVHLKECVIFGMLLVLSSMLNGCAAKDYAKLLLEDADQKVYEGHYKVATLAPKDDKSEAAPKLKLTKKQLLTFDTLKNGWKSQGIASWYKAEHKNGKKARTANGDIANTNALTCAHRHLPLPSVVKIKNLKNNKSVIAMVNDRGPYINGRVLDVSERVADILDFKHQGVTNVAVEYLHDETQDLLKKISLTPKNGRKASTQIKNDKCSVNCYVKLMNERHGLRHEM